LLCKSKKLKVKVSVVAVELKRMKFLST